MPSARYTVASGDTLRSIAQGVYGDSNLWYLIANANGLEADDPLVPGSSLILPMPPANAGGCHLDHSRS